LGPLGDGDGVGRDTLKTRLDETIRLVPYIKIVMGEKLRVRLADPADYEKLFSRDEIDRLFGEVVSYYIDPPACQACGICARRCPAEAIAGGRNLVHVIDQVKCLKCGTCVEVCPARFAAVRRIIAASVPDPIAEDARIIVRK
jgi:F420-non-reducing hydrogenase iron-sulfur subunit